MADDPVNRKLHFGNTFYTFKEDVPRYLTCMVCMGLLKEAMATECCGKMLCASHLSDMSRGACPACRNKGYAVSRNKGIDGIVNDLKVFCINGDKGCSWSGHLCFEPQHRQSDDGCPHEVTDCKSRCGFRTQRKDMDAHCMSECPLRSFRCEYCSLNGVYKAILTHWESCPQFPVSCPNGCGSVSMKRVQLQPHLNTCPEHVIDCQFKDVGCTAKIKRSEDEQHMTTFMASHMVCLLRDNRDLRQTVSTLQLGNESLRKDLKALKTTSAGPRKQSAKGPGLLPTPSQEPWQMSLSHARVHDDMTLPQILRLQSVVLEKTVVMVSPAFYTQPGGYRLLMVVFPHGRTPVAGQFVSVIFHLLPGRCDTSLQWPFQGSIKVEVLNQVSDSRHQCKTVHFEKFPDKFLRRSTAPPNDLRRGGWGIQRFMPVGKLSVTGKSKFSYVAKNQMYVRLSMVTEEKSPNSEDESGDSSDSD